MKQKESAQRSALAREKLDCLLERHQIRLGETQRRCLQSLSVHCGEAIVWDRQRPLPAGHRLIILVEPPTGPSAELFHRSLNPGSVVVIPFGENPAFDFLKSKMTDFGTVGASGTNGPHQLWWGGPGWSSVNDAYPHNALPLVVSCYPAQSEMRKIDRLRRSLEVINADFVIEPIDALNPHQMLPFERTAFVQNMWSKHDRPILWVDPDSVVASMPSLPGQIGCDFAVHKWNRWEMSARTLYFGRSSAAEALLNTWHCFASSYPDIWDGYVLDQAWSLVSSQMPLETVWLPRSYHSVTGERANRKRPVIIHDIEATTADFGPDADFPKVIRAARRASRIGAPEPLIVMKARDSRQGAVTVILRDIRNASASAVAAIIESVMGAFAADPGGFDHLELSLCPWQQDVKATVSAANFANNRILEIVPSENLPSDIFRRFADADDSQFGHSLIRSAAFGPAPSIVPKISEPGLMPYLN